MIQNFVLRLKLLAIIRFAVVGVIVGTGIGYINYRVIDAQPQTTIGWGVIAGFGIGSMIGSMEVFLFFGQMRRAPFLRLLAMRAGVYAATFVFWLSLANAARVAEARGLPFLEAGRFYLLEEGIFLRDFALTTLAAVVFVWILQAAQLQRWLDVFNFILGKYHRPQEVESVFLFVDVTSSTTIAEKLGHLAYSSFLQDFFYDVNMAALATRGSIYQYVGDEVIVTWPIKRGTERANCVECYFRILDEVDENKDHYLEEYGVFPEFRAGLHGGTAVVTWVGETKKEIVYHGDVLNTAARIQVESKQGQYHCLVSGELLDQMSLPAHYSSHPVGKVELRGKEGALPLFGLEREASSTR